MRNIKELTAWLKANTFKAKVKAWSYSRLSEYEKCPFMFARKHLVKEPYEENRFAERGTMIHQKCEEFVKGNITGMPKELRAFGAEFKELKRLMAHTEIDLAVTRNWQATTYDDWNNVWCRARGDSLVIQHTDGTAIDYKTGGIYPESHEQQLELMAVLTHAHNPELETVDAEAWYIDKEDVLAFNYTAPQLIKLRKKWEKKAAPMFAEKKWLATPSDNNCFFCPFKKKCDYYEK